MKLTHKIQETFQSLKRNFSQGLFTYDSSLANSQQLNSSTANSQQPTANSQQPTANSQEFRHTTTHPYGNPSIRVL